MTTKLQPRAAVKNAADPQQVKRAGELEERSRERELNDLRVVLQSREGRRTVWRLLEKCRAFESVFEASAKIYYNAGRQDVGHYLMAEVVEADEEALFLMMRENKQERFENV